MFLKQEEWFLNPLRTEIPEHLPGLPQMDQQSLKEKMKYLSISISSALTYNKLQAVDRTISTFAFPILLIQSELHDIAPLLRSTEYQE